MNGTVYLVGAGPGDPGLITVRGLDLLRSADAVVYDRLIHKGLLEEITESAERRDVGKSAGRHKLNQDEINALLVRLAGEGKIVVRLKGGDPFVFGRGGEEAQALRKAGVPFEIVPGVTAGVAVAEYAGIPVTHRGTATQCLLVTGHETPEKSETQVAWDKIAALENATIVGFMSVSNLSRIVSELLDGGKNPSTPAALIERGTTSSQRTVTGRLDKIVDEGKKAGIEPPAVFVIGETVSIGKEIDWFGNRPLFGKRLVVTRARDQASALVEPLRFLGAEIVHLPVIGTEPVPVEIGPLFQGAAWDWILFTSENGVRHFVDALRRERLDARLLGPGRIAAVGSGTANRLRLCGLEPDFVPSSFTTASLADGLNEAAGGDAEAAGGLAGKRVLRVGPEMDHDALLDRLVELDAEAGELRVYRIVEGEPFPEVVDDLKERGARGCLFTSGSTVRHFFRVLGERDAKAILAGATAFAIGPVTAGTLREAGIEDIVTADEHSIPGLVRTVREALQTERGRDMG